MELHNAKRNLGNFHIFPILVLIGKNLIFYLTLYFFIVYSYI